MRDRLGLGELLDRAAQLVRELPERTALAMLAGLPYRLLQVWLFHRLIELGSTATQHGRYLLSLSLWSIAALPLAFWGKAQLARGCSIALAGEDASLARSRFGIPCAAFLTGLYPALVAQALYPAFGWMVLPLPLVAAYSGLAAASAPYQEKPGLWVPLEVPARGFASPVLLAGLWTATVVGLVIAWFQIFVLFELGLWAAQTAIGAGGVWWQQALSPSNRLFVLLVIAGAILVVEPFWIAGLSILVRRGRARATGEDLSAWIAELDELDGPAGAEGTAVETSSEENAA